MIDPTDDEALLARFGQWLQNARAEADQPDGDEPLPPDADVPDVGLYQLIEEFTALRQELKLQTRSTRGLQEQSEALLAALRQALDQFRAVEPKEAQAVWSVGRPLAEALAELDDALDRGRTEVEKAGRLLIDEPPRAFEAALADLLARQSFFGRRRARSYHEKVREMVRQQDYFVRRDLVAALVEGYVLVHNRLQRALKAVQIERIACVGRPVDPALMTVVEVLDDPARPPGEVVAEIRRGYTWQGRLLRYAEVRAVRTTVL